ncbi:DUF1127 domain-containing protein [Methylobacterium platani]|uniref:YjiS-like domain-containing protein n=2 Tax=Methylobacterium platani TaxID=427683 RepID=A0A179S7P4_9HYPH|nr:DUF1127 domain-containing protein [Methylobacterium platani]KMO14095.1 hypothetical protein SQ03_20235 [Methylobacterium platani JCM 14648]OAS22271.1 hypothetical protein A5481_20110 [Methylobacterium platani]
MPPLIRRLLALRRPPAPWGGPPGEGAVARFLRQARDRTRLADLDDRLLRDLGLRREVSGAGFDFLPLSSAASTGTAGPASSPDDCQDRAGTGRAATSSTGHGAIDWP